MTLSQSSETNSNYVLIDKATHEELRKNIEDYKALIIDYEKVKFALSNAMSDNKNNNEKIIIYQKEILELQDKIMSLNNIVASLTLKLENAQRAIVEKDELYNELKKARYRDQAKIYKMKGYQHRFETQGMVILGLSIWLIIEIATKN